MKAFSADDDKANRHKSPPASARGGSLVRGPARRGLALQSEGCSLDPRHSTTAQTVQERPCSGLLLSPAPSGGRGAARRWPPLNARGAFCNLPRDPLPGFAQRKPRGRQDVGAALRLERAVTVPLPLGKSPSHNATRQNVCLSQLPQRRRIQCAIVGLQLAQETDSQLKLSRRRVYVPLVTKPCVDVAVEGFVDGRPRP